MVMKMKLVLPLAILSLIVVAIGCQSTKTATSSKMLRFNFENGKGYDYEMDMNMDQEIMGQRLKMDMLSYYSMDVNGMEGESRVVTTKFERVKMNMDMAGMKMEFDSDKKGTITGSDNPLGMMNKVFGALVGKKFTMKINPEGKVEEVRGFKEMMMSMIDSMGLEGEDREKAMAQFNQQFNEEGMRSQFERVLYIFPNKEVKVGDSWEKNTTAVGQIGGNYKSVYKVKEIEGDMVTLEEKSKVEGVQTGMDMKGMVTGLIVVDSKSGLVVSAEQDMDIKLSKEGQSFNMVAKNKIKGKAR
jgi:hypothetical protein